MRIKSLFFIAFMSLLFLPYGSAVNAQNKKDSNKKALIEALSSSNYADKVSKGLVFVDFWAPWCGPCRKMAPVLDELAKEYEGVVQISKLNVDNYKQFAINKGVNALPTIVVYKDGKEIDRLTGLMSKDDLVKAIEAYSKTSAD